MGTSMNRIIRASALMAVVVALGGCFATGAKHRPIVDGSDPQKYEADLLACQEVARQRSYVNADVQLHAAVGGAIGAVANGVEGAVAGAAVGGGTAAVDTVRERKAIVINCMEARGHRVVESRYSR